MLNTTNLPRPPYVNCPLTKGGVEINVTWEDAVDGSGVLERRRYRRLSLSWLEPSQARELLEETGFTVEDCFGDFQRTPFAERSSPEQVWIARKPD